MAKKRAKPELLAEIVRVAELTAGGLRWTVKLENPTDAPIGVGDRIRTMVPSEDGTVLEVSTSLPPLPDNVYIPMTPPPGRRLEPGESVEHVFGIDLPLRIVKLVGVPPVAEITEWRPADEFELRMSVGVAGPPTEAVDTAQRAARAPAPESAVQLEPMRVKAPRGARRGAEQS